MHQLHTHGIGSVASPTLPATHQVVRHCIDRCSQNDESHALAVCGHIVQIGVSLQTGISMVRFHEQQQRDWTLNSTWMLQMCNQTAMC